MFTVLATQNKIDKTNISSFFSFRVKLLCGYDSHNMRDEDKVVCFHSYDGFGHKDSQAEDFVIATT